jgi:hypothetical protein
MNSTAEEEVMMADLRMSYAEAEDDLEDDLGLLLLAPGESLQESAAASRCSDAASVSTEWEKINEILRQGNQNDLERIELRRTIDFPYADACPRGCKCDGNFHLNLDRNDSILERAWVFQIDNESHVRLILHGHTFLKWSDRGHWPVENRADALTSLNWRLAVLSARGWRSDSSGETVLPLDGNLQKKWREYFRSHERETIFWNWRGDGPEGLVPKADKRRPHGERSIYERMRGLLLLHAAHGSSYVPETYAPWQTDRLVRSHSQIHTSDGPTPEMVHEVQHVHEVEVFNAKRRPYRSDINAAAATPEGEWENLHVAALCIGITDYRYLNRLKNARNDAVSFKSQLEMIPHCKAELVDGTRTATRAALWRSIQNFIDRLKNSPPKTVLITYSGHGGTMKHHGEKRHVLIPADSDPNDKVDAEINLLTLHELLKLCQELDKEAMKKSRPVSFVIILDACRVSVGRVPEQSAGLEGPAEETPRAYLVCSSCRLEKEAMDGSGVHSPFAKELLDPKGGIFTMGMRLKEGLDGACERTKERTTQEPTRHDTGVPLDLCLFPNPQERHRAAAQEHFESDITDVGSIVFNYESFKGKDKNELESGSLRFDGEAVIFSKEKGLTASRKHNAEDSPFFYDSKLSKNQMKFKCRRGQYILENGEPSLGTWIKIVQPIPLCVGMIFKVGTDQVQEGTADCSVRGFNFPTFYTSCLKIASLETDRCVSAVEMRVIHNMEGPSFSQACENERND